MALEAKQHSLETEFREFSSANSWYKNIPGVQKFYIVPSMAGFRICSEDCLMFTKLDPLKKSIVKKYPITVTPFIYPANETCFGITLAKWGWQLFAWMKQNGYVEEAKTLMLDCGDASGVATYYGNSRRDKTPALESLYSREYKRMLDEAIAASQEITKALLCAPCS